MNYVMNWVTLGEDFILDLVRCVKGAYNRLKDRHRAVIDKDTLKQYYFESATHYYILARYAVFARAIPTAGNLFHHALERYLKGYLCLKLSEKKRRQLGHSLNRTWKIFKRVVGDPALAKYDATIRELDKFESIRYPEKFAELGAQIHFDLGRPRAGTGPTTSHPPVYTIFVEELDEFVNDLFLKSGLNPKAFVIGLSPQGVKYLRQDNSATIWQSL